MAGARVANDKGLIVLVVAVLVMCGGGMALEANLVPAVYVFGDSTVDVGNNGPLELPYGIDLPHEYLPSGRFSNGYNLADYISKHLGFNMSPPAYMSLTPETSHEILRGFGGVSYASGGSGILNTTRLDKDNSISMSEQVEFFAATKSKMTEYTGGSGDSVAIATRLSKSLFLISAGGNDIIITPPIPFLFPIFYTLILNSFTKHVQTLYDLGARRFGIIDVPPIGCVPLMRSLFPFGTGCIGVYNDFAKGLNDKLEQQMAKIAADPERPGMVYSVGSSYNMVTNFTTDPEAAGFKNVTSACFSAGRLEVEGYHQASGTVCDNRADYMFWDFVHGTEAIAKKGAAMIFSDPVEEGFAKPINFEQLVSSSTHGSDGVSSS
uniref:Uncharacterized protein n=1 Tax=Avena sativa TaxID=4498 RepID=A0ACD5W7K7_AVESA